MKPSATQAQWPVIDNVIAPFAEWWRRHALINGNMSDLDAFSPAEMAHIAQDVGVSAGELRVLARHGSDAAHLLERRLDALGLSSAELANTACAQLRDMERLCTLCRSKNRCQRDLAADPGDSVWRRYCPNEETLTALARDGLER
jgi:hypothetical protein